MQILIELGSDFIATIFLVAQAFLVGTAAFDFLVWRRTNLPSGPVRSSAEHEMSELILSCGRWSSLVVLVLAVPRSLGAAAQLDDRVPLLDRFRALAFQSEWGIGLLAMLLAGALSWLGYAWAARGRRGGWPLVFAGVLLVGVGSGLQGHPAEAFSTQTLAPLLDGVHALSTGGWLGSFFLLTLAAHRLQPHTASPWTDPLGAMLSRYFAISGAFVAAVILTGLFSAATHLRTFDDVTDLPYGHVLAGKVIIVGIVLLFNEHHRRHAERRARTAERPHLMHTLRFEAGLIILVLALTAVLRDTDPPGVNEVRSEVFRSVPKGAIRNNDVEIRP